LSIWKKFLSKAPVNPSVGPVHDIDGAWVGRSRVIDDHDDRCARVGCDQHPRADPRDLIRDRGSGMRAAVEAAAELGQLHAGALQHGGDAVHYDEQDERREEDHSARDEEDPEPVLAGVDESQGSGDERPPRQARAAKA